MTFIFALVKYVFHLCTSEKLMFLVPSWSMILPLSPPRRPMSWQEWPALTCAVCWGSAWPPPCSWSHSWCRTAASLNMSGRTRITSVPSCSSTGVSRLLRSVIKKQGFFFYYYSISVCLIIIFPFTFDAMLAWIFVDTNVVCVCVGNELPGRSSSGAQRFSCSQRPRKESKPREDHWLRSGPSARYRRDGISRWWGKGEMEESALKMCL